MILAIASAFIFGEAGHLQSHDDPEFQGLHPGEDARTPGPARQASVESLEAGPAVFENGGMVD